MLACPNIRDPNISGTVVEPIEPDTKVLQPPMEDSYVRANAPTSIHGALTYASYLARAADENYCYYKFDFSDFPSGLTVTTAKLELYNFVLIGGIARELNLEAHRITSAWSEASLIWNNKPSHTATIMGEVSMAAVWMLGWVEILLTDMPEVASMISEMYYGLMLKYSGTVEPTDYYRHYTKEYTTDPTLTPKLTVSYE